MFIVTAGTGSQAACTVFDMTTGLVYYLYLWMNHCSVIIGRPNGPIEYTNSHEAIAFFSRLRERVVASKKVSKVEIDLMDAAITEAKKLIGPNTNSPVELLAASAARAKAGLTQVTVLDE